MRSLFCFALLRFFLKAAIECTYCRHRGPPVPKGARGNPTGSLCLCAPLPGDDRPHAAAIAQTAVTDYVPGLTALSLILHTLFISFSVSLSTLSFPELGSMQVSFLPSSKKSPVHFLSFCFPTSHNNNKASIAAT